MAQRQLQRCCWDEILAYTGRTYRNLQSLKLEADTFSVQQLSHFKELTCLKVSGFSKASPRQSLDALQSMPSLRLLQLTWPAAGIKWRSSYFKCQNTISFMTPAAVQQLPALKVLDIFDLVDAQNSKQALLSPEMLKAVCHTHAHSLDEVTISSTTEPDLITIDFVIGLLMTATQIYRLSLTWPSMNVELLDFIPGTIRYLELAVGGPNQAEAFISRLSTMIHRLPYLQKIKLLMIQESTTASSQDQRIDWSVPVGLPIPVPTTALSGSLPWEVKWGIWHPTPVV